MQKGKYSKYSQDQIKLTLKKQRSYIYPSDNKTTCVKVQVQEHKTIRLLFFWPLLFYWEKKELTSYETILSAALCCAGSKPWRSQKQEDKAPWGTGPPRSAAWVKGPFTSARVCPSDALSRALYWRCFTSLWKKFVVNCL